MLHTVTRNHGTGAIFSPAAMQKDPFGVVAQKKGEHLVHLFLARSRKRPEREVHILHPKHLDRPFCVRSLRTYIAVLDRRLAGELLVLVVLDNLLNTHRGAIFEIQRVVCVRVRWKPVLTVYLLPVSLELGKLLILVLTQIARGP